MEKVGPLVLALAQASTQEENPVFQKVIEEAVTLELKRAGLRVISQREATKSSEVLAADTAEILKLGKQGGAEFVLNSKYSVTGSTIRIDLSWLDVGENRSGPTISRTSRLDLALDRIIREAVTEILDSERDRIASLVKEVKREEKPDSSRESATDGAASADLEVKLDKRFEVSVGFSPFIATGDVSEYFKLGLMPVLYGGYRFALHNGILAIGLMAGINLFQAEGLIASSQNLLIPVGPDLRYTFSRGGVVDLYARLAGGPALFLVNVEGTGQFTKIIPFATAGIGFTLPLSETLGLAVDASYAVYFDTDSLLMGFTPAAYIFVRF
jgi:TolB-like protein